MSLSHTGAMKTIVKFVAYSWLLVVLLPACSTIKIEEPQNPPVPLATGEAMAVLLNYQPRWRFFDEFHAHALENSINACVAKAVHEVDPSIKFVPPEEFRRVVFPDLEYRKIPSTAESFTRRFDNPEFRDRIASLNLRYMIIAHLYDLGTQHGWGRGGCIAGAGTGVCLVGSYWDKSSRIDGEILDVKPDRPHAATLSAEAKANGWFAIIGTIPIGYPALTHSAACDGYGKAVANALANGRRKQ